MGDHQRANSGDIATVVDGDLDESLPVVVLAEREDTVSVVPISERIEVATEWDLFLPASALGYDAIVQVWNYGSVLPEQLGEVLATLDANAFDAVTGLVRAAIRGEMPVSSNWVGPPVLSDDDPRLLFQDAEAERARVFWEPTIALAGSLTLGQLIAHRREELNIPAETLEPLGLGPGWLPALESDELDARLVLSASSLATLMRRLKVGASQRLKRIASYTLESQSEGHGAVLARGGGSADRDLPPVSEYVEAFLEDLGGE